MTKIALFIAGALALGLSTTAIAKPDYLDRMNPRPAHPAAQPASCDCPTMAAGSHAARCTEPNGSTPKGAPNG